MFSKSLGLWSWPSNLGLGMLASYFELHALNFELYELEIGLMGFNFRNLEVGFLSSDLGLYNTDFGLLYFDLRTRRPYFVHHILGFRDTILFNICIWNPWLQYLDFGFCFQIVNFGNWTSDFGLMAFNLGCRTDRTDWILNSGFKLTNISSWASRFGLQIYGSSSSEVVLKSWTSETIFWVSGFRS